MSSEVHAEDAVGRRKMPAAAAGAPVGSPWALVEYAGGSYIVADSSPDKYVSLQWILAPIWDRFRSLLLAHSFLQIADIAATPNGSPAAGDRWAAIAAYCMGEI